VGSLSRLVLGRAAARYAAAGWPVAAGAWWDGDRYRCATHPCRVVGPHLAGHVDIGRAMSGDAGVVQSWWAANPFTVALATGVGFDAVEVAGALGEVGFDLLRRNGLVGPAGRLPAGGWLFLVSAGVDAGFVGSAGGGGLLYHGRGSYLLAPPSRLRCGRVRWVRAPWVDDWRLPVAEAALDVLAGVCSADARQ